MAHDGLVENAGQCLVVFYDNDGVIGSHNPNWLQHAMNVIVGLFRMYGLADNVAKSRTMTCQPGALRVGVSEESMALKCTGVGDSYWVRLQRKIPCPYCVFDIAAGYITTHRHRMHST